MNAQHHDLVIVGAGPAGLSAARTAARLGFYTLLLDRLPGPGELSHTCHAVIAPVPDLITLRPLFGGLFAPQIDLWLPEELIAASDVSRRAFSPAGIEMQSVFASDGPVAIIKKPEVLRMMAEQATSAGAEIRFGVEVTGLIYDGDAVVGVTTPDGDFRASIVIAAEGAMGHLAQEAGLYYPRPFADDCSVSVTIELAAPAVRITDVGEIVSLGGHTAFGRRGFATLMMPAPGRAYLTVTGQAEAITCALIEPASLYLSEYCRDPRVAEYLAGARAVKTSVYVDQAGDAPTSFVTNGLMLVGDAIGTPGHVGILQGTYMGRQAALFAAEALDMGDTTVAQLAEYDHWVRERILPALASEARTTSVLMSMTDTDLDRLASLLNSLHLPIPFMGQRPKLQWEMVDWLMRELPVIQGDCALIQKVLGAEEAKVAVGVPDIKTPSQAEPFAN